MQWEDYKILFGGEMLIKKNRKMSIEEKAEFIRNKKQEIEDNCKEQEKNSSERNYYYSEK